MNKKDLQLTYELWRKFSIEPSASQKRRMRKYVSEVRDRFRLPMTQALRTTYPDDYSCVEYGIIPETDWTDDEILEFVNNVWVHNYNPYDCTGKLYTSSIHVSRISIGLAYVHHFALDV